LSKAPVRATIFVAPRFSICLTPATHEATIGTSVVHLSTRQLVSVARIKQ
jgi:hypothetical protein